MVLRLKAVPASPAACAVLPGLKAGLLLLSLRMLAQNVHHALEREPLGDVLARAQHLAELGAA